MIKTSLVLTPMLLIFNCSAQKVVLKTETWDNGNVRAQGEVIIQNETEIHSGIWNYWYPNGQPEKISDFDGSDKDFGRIQSFWSKDGEKLVVDGNGDVMYWDQDGQLELSYQLKDGLRHGVYRLFYANQVVKSEFHYSNGKLTGIAIGRYEDGSLNWIVSYQNGLRQGISIDWFENGMIHFIRDLVDDKIQGKVVEYYRSGKIKSVTNHHKSHYCGAYIEYFDNDSNTVKVQGEYKLNDSLEIDLSYLNKSNIEQGLISSVRYGKWTEYFENGNLKAHGMYYPLLVYEIDSVYIDNVFVTARRIPVFLKDGNWIYYDESGNVLKKEYYEKGALIE